MLTELDSILNFSLSHVNHPCKSDDKFSFALQLLDKYSSDTVTCPKKCHFLVEQLHLINQKRLHYLPESLLWSCLHFYSSPNAYKIVSESEALTLPHPYMRKLSTNNGMLSFNHS